MYLDRLRHLRARQLIAAVAAAALLFAMLVYGSHLHHPGAKNDDSTHCDLCLQFGSTGGPASPPKLVIRVALVVLHSDLPTNSDEPLTRELPRAHRSRAPPICA
jgi:hypothetical protein